MLLFTRGFLLLLALIHLVPLVGVVSVSKLHFLYGVTDLTPSLELLLRHRAVFFGLLGGMFLYSVFYPREKLVFISLVLGFLSMTSFLILYVQMRSVTPELFQVAVTDAVVLAMLVMYTLIYAGYKKAGGEHRLFIYR